METSLIIFLLASAASFWPAYWLLGRWFNRDDLENEPTAASNAGHDSKSQFIAFLRSEGAVRIIAALDDAATNVEASAECATPAAAAAHKDTALDRLREARQMVKSLYSDDVTEAFDKVIITLGQRRSASPRALLANILDLKVLLDQPGQETDETAGAERRGEARRVSKRSLVFGLGQAQHVQHSVS